MAKDDRFLAYIVDEVLRGVNGITSRYMFGAYGLYKDGVFFAIVEHGTLYFKVDDATMPQYQQEDSSQFTYKTHTGKEMKMDYWEVPGRVMEDADEVALWAQKSYQVGLNSKRKKK